MTDPLRSAILDLYDTELRQLLDTYRVLAYHEIGTKRAFYMSVAAHLNLEVRNRRRTWTGFVADMLDDGTAGQLVE
ncbi:MAG: hypothetical protein LC798_20895 [Chloroflexi bacterium]|nr:hypothetical protein [Chloroflexota bacterium]